MNSAKLTPRERTTAERLAVGRTNHEIAGEMDISVKTVDTHRGHILQKLGLKNNAQLAHYAIANGWVPLMYQPPAPEVKPQEEALS